MRTRHLATLLLVFASVTALAQDRAPAPPAPAASPAAPAASAGPPAVAQGPGVPGFAGAFPGLPTVALEPLLQRVGRAANKKFLIDSRVNPQIYLGGVDTNDVTYPLLLSILRANNLAVTDIEGRLNVIPMFEVRFYAAMLATDEANVAADEWRTRVVQVTNIEAANLVPILRPMLPQSAHLAAFPMSNSLVIVDRVANLKRITEIIRTLDKSPPR